MPLSHFIHVTGFEVPILGEADHSDPLIVILDKEPAAQWRAVFQDCINELPLEMLRTKPVLEAKTIRMLLAVPMTRGHVAAIRALIELVNRRAYLNDRNLPQPL